MTAPDTVTLFVLPPVLIPVDDNPGGAFGEVLMVNGVIIGGPGEVPAVGGGPGEVPAVGGGPGELPAVGGGPVTGTTERIK